MSQEQTTFPFVNIVDLLGKCPAEGALFTTFTLSLAWFEVYLLRHLERNGARRVAILADPTGIQSSLREGLVSGPGIHYALEPVRQRAGYFHPKLAFLWGDSTIVVAVGSGNLTLPGMQRNLETWDVLFGGYPETPEEHQLSRVVAEGALKFLASLRDEIDKEAWAQNAIREAAAALEELLPVLPEDNGVRWLDTFVQEIGFQIAEVAPPTSASRRLQFLSPFYDEKGEAIQDLAEWLGATRLELLFTDETTFPLDRAAGWSGVRLDAHQLAVATTEEALKSPRPLHAKVYRVIDEDRSLLVAGSANATKAGLWSTDNVEVCLARTGSRDAFDSLLRSAAATPQLTRQERLRRDRLPFSIDWARATGRAVRVKLSAHKPPPQEVKLGYVEGDQEPEPIRWTTEPIDFPLPDDFDPLRPRPMRVEAAVEIDGRPCMARAWVSFEEWLEASPEWRRSTRAWNRVLDKMSFGADEEDAELLRIFGEEHSRTMILLGNRGGSRSAAGSKDPQTESETPIPLKLLQAAASMDLRLLRRHSEDSASIRHVDTVRAAMLRVFHTLEHGDLSGDDSAGDSRAEAGAAAEKHAKGLPRSVREALDLFEERFRDACEALEETPRYPDHVLTYAGLCLRLTIRFRLLDDDGHAGLWHGIERMVGAMLSLRSRVEAGPVLTLLKKEGAQPPAEILAQYAALLALLHWKIAEDGHLDGEAEVCIKASYSDDSLREALATLERFCDHRVPAPVLPAQLLQLSAPPHAELESLLEDLRRNEAPSQHALWLKSASRRLASGATTLDRLKEEEGWRALERRLAALGGSETDDVWEAIAGETDEEKMLKAAARRAPELVTPWVKACPRCYISLVERARQRLKQRHPAMCSCGRWLLPSEAT